MHVHVAVKSLMVLCHVVWRIPKATFPFAFPERIWVRVIDPFTIKPLDSKTISDHTRATKGRILTVEDHYYEGRFAKIAAHSVSPLHIV